MSEPRRLHPIAALLSFLKRLRELLLPFLFFFFVGGGEDRFFDLLYYLVMGGTIIVLLIIGILHWYRYTYRVEDGELRIEYGVFINKKRFIPLERIQTIDISSGIIQRLFGLVKLQVQTAGGGTEAEVELSAITEQEANELKIVLKNIYQGTGNEELISEIEEEIHQYKISQKELLIAASTSGGIGIVISGMIAFASQFDELIPYDVVIDRFEMYLNVATFLLLTIIAIIVIVISWVIGIILIGLKYANFTLTKRGNELIVTRGLIEKKQLTIPLSRIQAIRIVENPIRQPLGYATVYVESAGGSANKEEDYSTLLFPLIKKDRLEELFSQFIPEYVLDSTLKSVPKRSLLRYLVRITLPVIPIVILISYFFRGWGYLSILAIPLALGLGYLRYVAAGWQLTDDQLVLRYRFLNKVTVLLKKRRIQAIEEKQSYFQEKKKLSTLQASIRSSVSGKSFHVVDLDEEDCNFIVEWFSRTIKKENG